jgi:hypothetical protein
MNIRKTKKRAYLILPAILLLAGVVMWWYVLRHPAGERDISGSDPLAGVEAARSMETDATSPVHQKGDARPEFEAFKDDVLLAMTNRPLTVTGVVIDEDGRPIAGASIGFNSYRGSEATPTRFVASKDDGTFDIAGEDGMKMYVSASHENYLKISATSSFVYPKGSIFKRGNSVDSGDFLTLRMRKRPPSAGLKAVSARRDFDSSNWVVAFDMVTGKTRAGAPSGQREIGFYLELGEGATPNIESRFDWTVTVQVPRGGGAQWRTDPKAYEAPENGYEETLVASFNAEDTNWTYVAERNVFVRFADGTYGRLNFRVSAATRSLTLSSYHNPSGDRNLFP